MHTEFQTRLNQWKLFVNRCCQITCGIKGRMVCPVPCTPFPGLALCRASPHKRHGGSTYFLIVAAVQGILKEQWTEHMCETFAFPILNETLWMPYPSCKGNPRPSARPAQLPESQCSCRFPKPPGEARGLEVLMLQEGLQSWCLKTFGISAETRCTWQPVDSKMLIRCHQTH